MSKLARNTDPTVKHLIGGVGDRHGEPRLTVERRVQEIQLLENPQPTIETRGVAEYAHRVVAVGYIKLNKVRRRVNLTQTTYQWGNGSVSHTWDWKLF